MTGLAAKFLTENTYDYLNARLVSTIESSSAPLKVKTIKKTNNFTVQVWPMSTYQKFKAGLKNKNKSKKL